MALKYKINSLEFDGGNIKSLGGDIALLPNNVSTNQVRLGNAVYPITAAPSSGYVIGVPPGSSTLNLFDWLSPNSTSVVQIIDPVAAPGDTLISQTVNGIVTMKTLTSTGPGTVTTSGDGKSLVINFPNGITGVTTSGTNNPITATQTGTTVDLTFNTGSISVANTTGSLDWSRVSNAPTVPVNLVDLADVTYTGTPANGDVLKWNTDHWEFGPDQVGTPGSGITAIGINVPTFMSSSHPSTGRLTADGDITLGFATQDGRKVFAAPNDGSLGAPTFRVLTESDISGTISTSKLSGTIATTAITAGSDGQYLKTVGTSVQWATIPGAGNLDSLTDVVITTPATGQVLSYNGTNWVNQAPGAGNADGNNLGSATDGEAIFASATNGVLSFKRIDNASNKVTIGQTVNSVTIDVQEANLTLDNLGGTLSATKVSGTLSETNIPNISADKVTSGTLPVGRGGTGATTLTGVLIGNGTSAFTTAGTPSDGQYLRYTTAGGYGWSTTTGGGVTEVGLTAPTNEFNVGSSITSTGNLSFTWKTQNANVVLAGPSSGGAATPTFRALVADDIPSLDATKITSGNYGVAQGGTGLTSYAVGDILYANTTSSLAALNIGTNGKFLSVVSGVPAWVDAPTGSGGVSVQDEGGTGANATTFNFIGTGVSASVSSGTATITVPTTSAINLGGTSDGEAIFTTKSGENIQLKRVLANSNKVTIGSATNSVTVDVNESNISINNLNGTLVTTKLPTVPVDKGGTGLTTLTANALLVGNGTSNVTFTPAAASGFLRYTGSAFVWTTELLINDSNPTLSANLNTNGRTITGPTDTDIVISPAGTGNTVIGGVSHKNKVRVVLNDNQSVATNIHTYSGATYEAVMLDYIIRRGTSVRIGTLMITHNGTTTTVAEYGSQNTDTGVVLSANYNSGTVEIKYTSTNTGTAPTFTYTLRAWDAD